MFPHAPTNVTAKDVTNTSVTIVWNPPTFSGHSDITHYEVQYQLFDDNNWNNWPNTTENVTATIGHLLPYTAYVFRVRAVNEIGPSEYSEQSEKIQTKESLPDAVNNVNATVIGPNSIHVTWARPDDVPGKLKGFHVFYGSNGTQSSVNTSTTSHNLTELTANTNYSIQVAAETGAGIGPRSPQPPIFRVTKQDRKSTPSTSEFSCCSMFAFVKVQADLQILLQSRQLLQT